MFEFYGSKFEPPTSTKNLHFSVCDTSRRSIYIDNMEEGGREGETKSAKDPPLG